MRQTYDLVVPLGYACSCSQTLRRAGLQLVSFPWDWVGVPPPSERCRIICEGFKDFMNLEDEQGRLQYIGDEIPKTLVITDDKTYVCSLSSQVLLKRLKST